MPTPIRHPGADACPGALRLHAAADGPLARVRLPGGALTGDQLALLGDLATRWGDGHLELTSRANVQLRALTTNPTDLAARLSAGGLLPSLSHELVRNIAAPPLATHELRVLVDDLDRALCADPALAALPGRFLFAVGAVAMTADVAAIPAGQDYTLLFAGQDLGLRVPPPAVVPALLAAAHAFLDLRAETPSPPWRLAELPTGPAQVAARTAEALGIRSPDPATQPPGTQRLTTPPADGQMLATQPPGTQRTTSPADGRMLAARQPGGETPATPAVPSAGGPQAPLLGVVPQGGGRVAVGALVPLGRLAAGAIALLARAERLVITTWRGVLVPDLSPQAAAGWVEALATAGLPVEAESRWSGVTACAGLPGCSKSLADVRAAADAATLFVDGLPVHWIGCARGCGAPAGRHVRVEATPDGWAVTGTDATVASGTADLAEIVAAARKG